MPSPPRALGIIVGLTLIVAGGTLAAAQYDSLAEYESTTATVQTAGIEPLPNDTFQQDFSALTRAGERIYVPNVTYTYTVDGERYTGTNVAAGTDIAMGDRDKITAALAGVQRGPATVYYHPSEPADSHLLRHLEFFPAGVLLLCGFLVTTDALTPRPRLTRALAALFPLETLERLPGVDSNTATGDVGDPTEILTAKRAWAGTDPAPFRGRAGAAIWLLCYLLITDIIVAYFLLSSPPYDLWAVAAAGVVFAGLARLGFSRVID